MVLLEVPAAAWHAPVKLHNAPSEAEIPGAGHKAQEAAAGPAAAL